MASDGRKLTISYLSKQIIDCTESNFDSKVKFVINNVIETLIDCDEDDIKQKLKLFKYRFKARWNSAKRNEKSFFAMNKNWLNQCIEFKVLQSSSSTPSGSRVYVGRPKKPFGELSESSKRKKTKAIRRKISPKTLVFAAQMSLRSSGNPSASNLIKEMTQSSMRAKKMHKTLRKNEGQTKQPPNITQALSTFIDADLTRHQYNTIRGPNKDRYPCYSVIQSAKKECYPASITVTEILAKVKLQDLLDHTALRLCDYLSDVINSITQEERDSLELISKWGCDGSQQNQFKQKFENKEGSDANIFQSSMVPIRLVSTKTQRVIWQNPSPSSPRFCRPIRIQFVHETTDVTKEEVTYIQNQIESLNLTVLPAPDLGKIKHTLLLTMIDGKVCNAITDTASTMRCYLCQLTSKDFNNLKLARTKNVEPNRANFGLSVLHARIRFF